MIVVAQRKRSAGARFHAGPVPVPGFRLATYSMVRHRPGSSLLRTGLVFQEARAIARVKNRPVHSCPGRCGRGFSFLLVLVACRLFLRPALVASGNDPYQEIPCSR